MKLRTLPFHSFAFVAFQIITIYSINVNEAKFRVVLAVLAIALLLTTIFFFSFRLYIKDSKQTSIIITLYIFLFFIYGRIYDMLLENPVFGLNLARNKYLLPLFCLIMLLLTIWVLRSKVLQAKFEGINYYFNIISIALIFISISTAMISFDWTSLGEQITVSTTDSSLSSVNKQTLHDATNHAKKPNIYFMIFDSYTSHRVLETYYDWNDSSVVDALINQGFDVDTNARSNYCFTGASIGATLSMRYIHEDPQFDDANNHANYIGQFYKKNDVMERFKSEGYEIVSNIGSHHFPDKAEKKSLLSDDFVQLIIHLSMLRIIENELVTEQIREDILVLIEGLKTFKKPEKPTFLFLHTTAPHAPFVFNANGARPQYFESAFGKYEDKHKYLEQVKFIGTQIIEIAENIKSQDPEAIIVITSDHGYGGLRDEIYLNRFSEAAKSNDHDSRPPKDYLDARFGILSAIHTSQNIIIPDQITPVNLFKYIFSEIFNDSLKVLPDLSFFTVIKEPYVFHDITQDLQSAESLSK